MDSWVKALNYDFQTNDVKKIIPQIYNSAIK